MTNTVAKFSNNGSGTEFSNPSPFGRWTSENLTDDLLRSTEEWLTSLPWVFPVSHFQLPERDKAIRMNATCGLPPSSAFAWYDPNTSCWRTFQVSLFTNMCDEYMGTWPRAGILCHGIAYRRLSVEQTTYGAGSGLWPTCRVWMAHGVIRKKTTGQWANVKNIEDLCGGAPDPNLAEWMMGFPMDWTDLNHLVMPKCLSVWLQSGKSFLDSLEVAE